VLEAARLEDEKNVWFSDESKKREKKGKAVRIDLTGCLP
jgi:hypothetical protein